MTGAIGSHNSDPIRRKLPGRRQCITEKIVLGDLRFHISFGIDPDDQRIRDIWIDGPKAGSDAQKALHDASASISVALQHGIPAATLAAAMDMPEGTPQSPLAAALTVAAAIDHGLATLPPPAAAPSRNKNFQKRREDHDQ